MEDRPTDRPDSAPESSSEFFDALRKGALIGAALLVLIVPPLRMAQQRQVQTPPPVAIAPAQQAQPAPVEPPSAAAKPSAPPVPGLRLADFGNTNPSPDVRLVANWAVHTRNHGQKAFVVIDKKFAQVYVFDPAGRLKAHSPALLGEAVGDYTTPGVGDKPLWQLKPYEKTTPAGRFVAEIGENAHHQDVVWIDYDNAVSMHRVIKGLPHERRAVRLASATYKDNRISNGCVNLPKAFYENVLAPTVRANGAVIYVLPEVKTIQQALGAWDVTSAMQLASASR